MIQLDQINTLVLELTSYCNLHCPQCPRFTQDGFLNKKLTLGHLDFDIFSQNLDLTLLPNLQLVEFQGDYGDCAMHPDIDRFADFFKDVPTLSVVTNGSIRTPHWWKNFAKNFPNVEVTFSIDGIESTNHIYRINSSWKKIIKNVEAFITAGGSATWKYIVFKHNEQDLEVARVLAQNLGFKKFDAVYTNRSWHTGKTWPVMIDGNFLYNIEPSTKVLNNLVAPEHVVTLEKLQRDTHVDYTKCWLSRGEIYINFLGHVLPCCMTSGKTWEQTIPAKLWQKIVGDLNSIDITKNCLADIVAGDFYQSRLKQSWLSNKTTHSSCMAFCSK